MVHLSLITHNLLACHATCCAANNFPPKLTNVKLALGEADFNLTFFVGFFPGSNGMRLSRHPAK
jgi:hypothetical protein